MRLYPSFRRAVKAGTLPLDGFSVVLVGADYEFSADHATPADVEHARVSGPYPLPGARWEGGGEGEAGEPLPETLRAGPLECRLTAEVPRGCVVCAGGVLVGYHEFAGPEVVLTVSWPDGVLTVS